MKFGMFFLAEYVNLWVASLFIVTMFLGGYLLPWEGVFVEYLGLGGAFLTVLQVGCFLLKVIFIAICFIWIRWTLPRFKYQQLMNLGWMYLLPISIANVLVIALGVALWHALAG
jgi:NADH-quinone oxidoreductase subunit H